MTDYAGYVYPIDFAEAYQQSLTGSLDDGLDRPAENEFLEVWDFAPKIFAPEPTHQATPRQTRQHDAYIFPEWSGELFGHILVIPPRLDLGNITGDQFRTVEIANLFLHDVEWEQALTDVFGLQMTNVPVGEDPGGSSVSIAAFGNFVIEVSIDAEGPASVDGDITLVFDVITQNVPVTGQRVVILHYQPLMPIQERLEWRTNIITARDGTEQRVSVRDVPRQIIGLEYIKNDRATRHIQSLLFDWLSRLFAVPVWWEARGSSAPIIQGSVNIPVPTDNGSFAVSSLVLVYQDDDHSEAVEVESFDGSSITVTSQIAGSYPSGTLVMPVRIAYANTIPQSARTENHIVRYALLFTAVDGEDHSDASESSSYDGRVYMDDCNLSVAGEGDFWERPVTVLDNETGRVVQVSYTDRSRFHTRKVWDITDQAGIWQIRRLLHHLRGSGVAFYIPTFARDMEVTDTIGPGATSFRVRGRGFAQYIEHRSPFSHVRLVRIDGTVVTRAITGSVYDADNDEEVISVDASFDAANAITVSDIKRMEIVMLARIADDKVEIVHSRLGEARMTASLVTVKE